MSPDSRPNILIYISHDTGRHIGPYGVTTVQTPNLERVAREGEVFANCFCTAPQCSPSRASLYTGRYPHQNGVMGLSQGDFAWDFASAEVHAAQRFASLGYDTAAIGTTHETRTPENRGFGFINPDSDSRHVAQVLQRWLAARGDSGNPFYTQIGTVETHRPWDRNDVEPDDSLGVTVPPYLDDTPGTRSELAAFQGSIKRWDEGLGHVLGVLDEQGLAANTLVVVTTDHGIAMPRAKVTLYDPGIGVLLMMRWPERIPAGCVYEELVSNVDVLPTLLGAIGITTPKEMAGRSLWPLSPAGVHQPRKMIFAEKTHHVYYDPMRCVRTQRYKYIRNFEKGVEIPLEAIVTPCGGGATYLENIHRAYHPRTHPLEELYDLQEDPFEQTNLAENPQHRETRESLAQSLAKWMRDTDDPLLRGPIASPFYRKAVDTLP